MNSEQKAIKTECMKWIPLIRTTLGMFSADDKDFVKGLPKTLSAKLAYAKEYARDKFQVETVEELQLVREEEPINKFIARAKQVESKLRRAKDALYYALIETIYDESETFENRNLALTKLETQFS